MELNEYFKSIVEQDPCAVVICNTDHEIIYMNPAAIARYAKRGGAKLIGQSLLKCHNAHSAEVICKVVDWFAQDAGHNRIFSHHRSRENKDVYMIALRNGAGELIGYYEKHEYRTPESRQPYDWDADESV